jgi:NAD(P)-dependent dehydrogenase (short-subunit alcohol dehydrogenase family)
VTEFEGKVALVTGSTNGIGKAIAERYAELGAAVVVNYASNEQRAVQTVDGIRHGGGEAVAIRSDITNPAEVETLFDQAIDHYGTVDIVVADAGVEIMDVSFWTPPKSSSTASSPSTPRARSSRSSMRAGGLPTTAGSSTSGRPFL